METSISRAESAGSIGAHDTPPPLARRLAAGLARAGAFPPVLDPACGTGELLLAAWRAAGATREAAGRLHGIELDAARASRARERLAAEIGGAEGRAAAQRVVVGDALAPDRPWPRGTAVLANPPWASFSGRQRVRGGPLGACGSLGACGREVGGAHTAGWPSLHGAFLVRIARHVAAERAGARLLLPASVCELEGYGPVRAAVTRGAHLVRPPEWLGEDAFPGVVEPAVLIELSPGAAATPGPLHWGDAAPPWLVSLEEFPRLPDECFADPGVHTGNAARELIGDLTAGSPGPGRATVREGRDLAPYRLGAPRRSLRLDLPRDGRRFRIGPAERYLTTPVLLRQTADRPLASLHAAPTYFRNTLLACRPPAELAPAFVVGVLNGPVAAAFHRTSFADARQRSFPQVKVSHLRRQPFPIAARDEDRRLHDLVAELVLQASVADEAERRRLVAQIDSLTAAAFGVELSRR